MTNIKPFDCNVILKTLHVPSQDVGIERREERMTGECLVWALSSSSGISLASFLVFENNLDTLREDVRNMSYL